MAMNAKDDAVSMTGTSETTTIGKVLTRYPTSVAGNDDDNSTIWKTIKNNPVILLCCLYANLGAFMYGFDNITLSLCLDMAPFVKKFGELVDGEYVVAAYWQSLWNAVPQLMTGIGAWTSGPIADRLGRRLTMFIAGITSATGVAVVFTADTNGQFLGGKMVNAIGLGMALASGQTYISEITPMKIRGIAMSILSSILTFFGMAYMGRRKLVLGGTAFAGILFLIMGICASLPNQQSGGIRWAIAITLQMAWLSIGPANGPALAVAGECSTMRLRAKTLAIGFFFNYFYSTIWNVVVPYMFNPGYGNLGGLLGWVFSGTCAIACVVLWFELPDTKDLTAAQIDERFENRVPTRVFRNKEYQGNRIPGKELEMGQMKHAENRSL